MRSSMVIGMSLGLVLFAGATFAKAAFLITDGSTFVENFDGYRGTTPTIPAGWVTAGDLVYRNGTPSDGNAQNGVFTAGSSLYVPDSGWYAMNSITASDDYAFGLRTQTSSTSSLTAQFVNATGRPLSSFDIGWDFEQYSEGYGNGQVDLQWSTDGTTFSSAGLIGGVSAVGAFGASPPVTYSLPTSSNFDANLPLLLADGESLFIRFFWTSVKPGNQPHIAVDNFALTAVPEPSTFLLTVLGMACLVAIGRSRRCRVGRQVE